MAEQKTKTPKAPRDDRYEVKLQDAAGAQLRFKAEVKNGKNISYVFHSGPKVNGKRTAGVGRGATQAHPTFEAARQATDAGVALAVKQGWVRPARAAATRSDSFDLKSIPAPKK